MALRWIREKTLPLKARWLAKVCQRLSANTKTTKLPLNQVDIAHLSLAWGNIGFAAGFSFLRHVGRRTRMTDGAILECGCGATTLLIATLTQSQGNPFVVFEHNLDWYNYMRKLLAKLGFNHVTLIHAPLTDYGNYSWYRIPEELQINQFSLVICDGPPGNNPGGRYGLLPAMQQRLAQDCVILLDDSHRPAEKRIIDIWRKRWCMQTKHIGRFSTYSELSKKTAFSLHTKSSMQSR
jgi:hypothetical protein